MMPGCVPAMNKLLRFLLGCLVSIAIPCAARDSADRVVLSPKLIVGQSMHYQIGYRSTTNTSTESAVVAPMAPTGGQTNASFLLLVEVEDLRVDSGRTAARLRSQIVEPALNAAASDAQARTRGTENPNAAGKSAKREKTVAFTLHGDGQVSDIEGLDRLSAEEQAAWQEWVARFGGGGSFPEKGIKPGEKWKTEEPISNALLTGLSWEKESEYVNDAPCG